MLGSLLYQTMPCDTCVSYTMSSLFPPTHQIIILQYIDRNETGDKLINVLDDEA